jgi:hypothetical protein
MNETVENHDRIKEDVNELQILREDCQKLREEKEFLDD